MVSKTTYSSILSERAQREILSSWEWYEERQRGLGDRFVEEVLNKISIIETNPDVFSIKQKSSPLRELFFVIKELLLNHFNRLLFCTVFQFDKVNAVSVTSHV